MTAEILEKSASGDVISAFAPAKINMTLHVIGRRDDGYHVLDSLVMFADIGDTVSVRHADETVLNITGPMAAGVPAGEDNLALRAARMMNTRAEITLLHAVLVNPMKPVLTAEVFRRLAKRDNPPMPDLPKGADAATLITWLSEMRNDLQDAAIEAEPAIAQVFATLEVTPGCLLTRMSGSGGTCFGLYADAETAASAAGRLQESHPGWWVKATRLNAH